MNRTFLTAEWRNLVFLNYAIDPAVLGPFLPAGTELDSFNGTTYVSMVGFQFLKTRVLGVAIPFHQDFEEVNLRFYVRAKGPEGWRRGVVFVKELVPRYAIAFIARTVYGEPYSALPMRHAVSQAASGLSARYEWLRAGRWEVLAAAGVGTPQEIEPGGLEEFITEHYWGYTTRRTGSTQYQVEHPRWRIWTATSAALEADIASLYGQRFVESLSVPPSSAFLAEGSTVSVRTHSLSVID